MGCAQSSDASSNAQAATTPNPGKSKSGQTGQTSKRKRHRRGQDDFVGIQEDDPSKPSQRPMDEVGPPQGNGSSAHPDAGSKPPPNPLAGGDRIPPAGGAPGAAALAPPAGPAGRNQSLAPNTYAHIANAPQRVVVAQPVVTNAGGEEHRRPFRTVLREALELAKAQRAKYGKFRKDEKHTVMELYDVIGLEEDTFLGPPNELQQRLAKFTFPPPNMHMLKEQEIDEDVVEYMLGAEEAKRRKQAGFEVAPAPSRNNANADGIRRRVGVSSEATATLQKIKVFKELPKTKTQTLHLMEAMQKSVLFKYLDSRDMKILFDAFEQETFPANTTIFEKGDDGDKFYLIENGRCQILIPDPDGGEARSIFVGEGDTFGELGVMYGTPRAATVVAVLDTVTWWIDRDTYRGTLLNQTLRKRERYMRFMEGVPILQTLDEYEKARIADVLEIDEKPQGSVVVKEGDAGEKFFIIEEGEVVVSKAQDGEVARLGPGRFFGEVALLFDKPRAATVTVASAHARLVSLSRTNFVSYLGPLEEKLRRNVDHYKQYMGKNRRVSNV
jgi:cAMP-dependent protein kinase regulator